MKTNEMLFFFCNNVALIAWLLILFAPHWKWTLKIVDAKLCPLVLSAVYSVLVILFFGSAEGDFSSLDGVAQLFRNRNILLAGWIHYLAFDFFVGSWELKDAQENHIPHLLLAPCLILTFLFGPLGFLAYISMKNIRRKITSRNEQCCNR